MEFFWFLVYVLTTVNEKWKDGLSHNSGGERVEFFCFLSVYVVTTVDEKWTDGRFLDSSHSMSTLYTRFQTTGGRLVFPLIHIIVCIHTTKRG